MAGRDGAPSIVEAMPDVKTERLDLRRFERRDLDELAAIFALEEVWRFPFGRGLSRAETERFLEGQLVSWDELGFGCWARTITDGQLIGFVGVSVPRFLPEILPAVEVG